MSSLTRVSDGAGPLDDRSCRLVKLGIAIGALAEGAVRSNARKARDAGVTPDEIRHAAVLAITTRGFPAAVAALGWIDEALGRDT
jgi:4-carboxymuconolactone decarboxylase